MFINTEGKMEGFMFISTGSRSGVYLNFYDIASLVLEEEKGVGRQYVITYFLKGSGIKCRMDVNGEVVDKIIKMFEESVK